MSHPRVLLHGFTGSPASWNPLVEMLRGETAFALPILGHHLSLLEEPSSTFQGEVERLASEIRRSSSEPVELIGYSMGARLGLGLLLGHPRLFRRAWLLGVNPGLHSEPLRSQRRAEDQRWAQLLEEGIEPFVREWEVQPLFASQRRLRPEELARERSIRLSHDPRGLILGLQALGLSSMPSYWLRLPELDVPTTLIVGGDDAKFLGLAEQMASRSTALTVRSVVGVGHNVALEAPAAFAALLEEA